MKGQSKRHSIIEAVCNVGSGMLLAFAISQAAYFGADWIQQHIWSGFVWKLSAGSNAIMTCILTIVSVIRGYIWRRSFNKIQMKQYEKN